MKTIRKIAAWEFLQNIKSRRFLTTTVLIPVIIFSVSAIGLWVSLNEVTADKEIKILDPQEIEKFLQAPRADTPGGIQQTITIVIAGFFAFVFIWSSLFSIVMVLMGVVREKQSRVVELLLSSVSAQELMLGKILGFAGLGLVQVLIWVAIGLGLFVLFGPFLGLPTLPLVTLGLAYMPWATVGLYVLFFVLGYLFIAALSAAMGATIGLEDILSGQQLQSTIIIMPTILPIMLLQNLIFDPNGTLAVVLSFIPFTAPATMLIRLAMDAQNPVPLWQTLLSLLVLALCSGLVMRLAAKIFAVGILLYGKSAHVREIWTWLRR
jgi:ABC-2 type transport system permease protein